MTTTETAPGPHVIVLFGATGDLAARKLFPGLFRLSRAGLLPTVRLVASSPQAHSDAEFRERVRAALAEFVPDEGDDADRRAFAARIRYVAASAEDGAALAEAVRRARSELGAGSGLLLYLAVPPSAMESMARMLGRVELTQDARLIVEKPFGTDLESARALHAALHEVIPEEAVFRIDHFLGKEAVQNILALRFANGLFEPSWNSGQIASVQIDVPEAIDIEGRSGFYESTGALRDMIATHLFQIMGFLALEPPARFTPEALRAEKAKLFASLRPLRPEDVVFGQYEGYRAEDGVAADSTVETFVALRAYVDNWRWAGVPFLLRTGKALAADRRTVTVRFREPPLSLFGDADAVPDCTNELVFELTDDPEIAIEVRAKRPGPSLRVGPARFVLDMDDSFPGERPLRAYERLLLDAMRGDQTLFIRGDVVERLWQVCDPVLRHPPEPLPYKRGSWGPEAADTLAAPSGWRVSRR